eukprot:15328689-Ditylum_brightwellii.AAC.1
MDHHHYLQIKWCMKLNNNATTSKRDVLTHNTNAITKHAALDIAGDETSCGHQGRGAPVTGLVKKVFNKQGVSKGGQIVKLTDIDHIHPHANTQHHKCWHNKKVKRIFKEKPVMCFDNYFSHDNTSDLADKKGYGLIYTVSCDCLPNGVSPQYMCKKRAENHSQPTRCA